jgi:hypothetical protein
MKKKELSILPVLLATGAMAYGQDYRQAARIPADDAFEEKNNTGAVRHAAVTIIFKDK